jgi:hypothetical protein
MSTRVGRASDAVLPCTVRRRADVLDEWWLMSWVRLS